MLAKLSARKVSQGHGKELREVRKSINVHEEYHRAFRTQSYADFFSKAQFLVKQPSFCHNYNKFSEVLLEPGQEIIPSILNNSSVLSKNPELKNLMLSYLDISAEASNICSNLLKSINKVQCNHEFIRKALEIVDDDDDHSQEHLELIVFELNSFIFLNNPFSNLNKNGFKLISDKYSSVLNNLKAMRKKVTKKIRIIKYLKKASGVCLAAACGLLVITATVMAAHTLTGLIMGPAILSFPVKALKKKFWNFRFLRSEFLGKVRDQLDVAAKGTYILSRDFDTMSRLVARLHGEIEHNRTMIKFCLDRKEEKFSLQIVKELRKSDAGFRKQVEELEEHVYLCLVTINRARALVIEEMTKPCI